MRMAVDSCRYPVIEIGSNSARTMAGQVGTVAADGRAIGWGIGQLGWIIRLGGVAGSSIAARRSPRWQKGQSSLTEGRGLDEQPDSDKCHK